MLSLLHTIRVLYLLHAIRVLHLLHAIRVLHLLYACMLSGVAPVVRYPCCMVLHLLCVTWCCYQVLCSPGIVDTTPVMTLVLLL